MTAAPILHDASHLANDLLRVIKDTDWRKVLIDSGHIDSGQVDFILMVLPLLRP